ILYTDVLNEIFKTHLDPRIGFLHTSNNRKFTLNLDIAEIFKPLIVDRTIFSLVNKGQIQFKHFENHKNGIFLSQEGIRIFLSTYDKRIGKVVNDSRTENIENSYRTMIRKECYRLEELFHKLKQNTRWVQLCS
ncbi:MAG: CRISPR-associated endonuclease Cas1, partial [Candidatus Aenigmarchaeota archaeon]|nr:CRISPR-associated endonuclease Cas1 [Candidatus Aenigmarchaeota archaeon]